VPTAGVPEQLTRPPDLALTVGISDYDDPVLAPLPDAAEEVRLVREALAATGFTTATPLLGGPRLAEVQAYLAQAERATGRLVVYWTGHGVAGPAGEWLFTGDSRGQLPTPESAVSVAWLAGFLNSLDGPTQVVVILDSCGAGATATRIARGLNDAPRARPAPGRRPKAISLISATYDESQALPLVFARALASALVDGPPMTTWPVQQAMVPPQALARAADGWLRAYGAPEAQRVLSLGVEAGTDFFANTRHNPNARDVILAGSAYVQRRGVLDAIDGWLASTDNGLFLLTGSMGTGKSTVVAQLAQSPGPTASTGARAVSLNLAGGLTLLGLLDALAPRVGATADDASPEAVVAAVAASGRRLELVVDSLEEADAEDFMAIVQRLLLPLSRVPGVHLLVAARGGAPEWSGLGGLSLLRQAASGFLDLDADPDAPGDITRHVARTLAATPSSPYRDQPGLVDDVAAAVATASAGVFLVASTVAATLARLPEALAPGGEELQAVLRAGMGGAIERDLARFGTRAGTVVDLLMPLAWAEGPGLPPGGLWLRMAGALSAAPERLTDATLDWVLASAGSYLAGSTREGELVYRLRHRAFVEYLRSRAAGDALSVHRSLTTALRPAAGTWPASDPYVWRYLAVHAERAGMLRELFEAPDVMAFADPHSLGNLAAGIPQSPRSPAVELYLRAGPLLDGLSPALRVFVLQSLERDDAVPGRVQRLEFSIRPPCRTRWTTVPPPSPHRLLRVGPDRLESLAILPAGGGWSLATATRDLSVDGPEAGAIEIFDPSSSVPSQQLRSTAGGQVAALAYAPAAGDSLLLCAYDNNVLEAWSMARRQRLWSRDTQRPIFYSHLVRSRGEWLLATTDTIGPARVWRPATGDYVASLQPAGGAIFVLHLPLQGREVLCLGTSTGMLSFLDADTFHGLGDIRPEVVWARAVFTVIEGQPVLVGARDDGRIELRHANDGRLLAISREESERAIETMCVIDSPIGRPAVATGDGALVSLWSTVPLARSRTLAGHTDDVAAVGVLPTPSGQAALVSAGEDGTIRIWPPPGDVTPGYLREPTPPESFFDVFLTRLGGRPVLLGQAATTNVVVDAGTGATIGSFRQPMLTTRDPSYTDHHIRAVVAWGDDAMGLTYHDGATLRMRSLASGNVYALPTPEFGAVAGAYTVVGDGPDALLVLGSVAQPASSFDVDGRLVARLEDSTGGLPRLPVALTDEPLAVVQLGDQLAVYDVRLGRRRRAVAIPDGAGRGAQVRPQVAALDGDDLWLLYDIPRDSTWLLRVGDGAPCVRRLQDGHAAGAAAVSVGGRAFAALAHRNEVLLLRPEDGSVALRIPFMGRVRGVAATGTAELCVIAGGCLVSVELAPDLR
jgi:WD40 repeat protein